MRRNTSEKDRCKQNLNMILHKDIIINIFYSILFVIGAWPKESEY